MEAFRRGRFTKGTRKEGMDVVPVLKADKAGNRIERGAIVRTHPKQDSQHNSLRNSALLVRCISSVG